MNDLRLQLDDKDLSAYLAPYLAEKVMDEAENGSLAIAIQKAVEEIVVSMIYGILVGKPGEYDNSGKAVWAEAETAFQECSESATGGEVYVAGTAPVAEGSHAIAPAVRRRLNLRVPDRGVEVADDGTPDPDDDESPF